MEGLTFFKIKNKNKNKKNTLRVVFLWKLHNKYFPVKKELDKRILSLTLCPMCLKMKQRTTYSLDVNWQGQCGLALKHNLLLAYFLAGQISENLDIRSQFTATFTAVLRAIWVHRNKVVQSSLWRNSAYTCSALNFNQNFKLPVERCRAL